VGRLEKPSPSPNCSQVVLAYRLSFDICLIPFWVSLPTYVIVGGPTVQFIEKEKIKRAFPIPPTLKFCLHLYQQWLTTEAETRVAWSLAAVKACWIC
jgi:hypothetical protein